MKTKGMILGYLLLSIFFIATAVYIELIDEKPCSISLNKFIISYDIQS